MGFHYNRSPTLINSVCNSFTLQSSMFNPWLLCLLLFQILGATSHQAVQWGLYRWVENQASIVEPFSKNKIEISHPAYPYLSISISSPVLIQQQFNCYNISKYTVQKKGIIKLMGQKTELGIEAHHVQQLKIEIKCQKEECQGHKEVIAKQLRDNQQYDKYCKEGQKYSSECTVENATLSLRIDPSGQIQVNKPMQSEGERFREESLLNFMGVNGIAIEPSKLSIAQHSLSSLINSICLFRGKDEDYFHLGFCQLHPRSKKWGYNFKLAAFSIYLLADYDYSLAYTVYKDYFSLLQTRLMYPITYEGEALPLPEHIEVLTRFGDVLQLQDEAQLLNSLFVIPMLNQLGTLHQELNYREAKKIHPLLLKMLQQKWSASSLKQSLKSIYEQSFTEDFKYHSYGEQLDQSITKNAWIFKVIDTYTGLLIKHHAFYMPVEQIKEHLQEHFTLLNIIKVYANDDKESKVGKYRDVVDVGEGIKLYGRYTGYEAILPYVYGLGKTYPEATLKELETSLGLKSSNQEGEQYEKKYRYRGDIHAYFNFKILTGCMLRVQEDKSLPQARRTEILAHLSKIAAAIGRKVMQDYKEQGEVYTSWTAEGKGRQKCGWGQIVSALFLKWA